MHLLLIAKQHLVLYENTWQVPVVLYCQGPGKAQPGPPTRAIVGVHVPLQGKDEIRRDFTDGGLFGQLEFRDHVASNVKDCG